MQKSLSSTLCCMYDEVSFEKLQEMLRSSREEFLSADFKFLFIDETLKTASKNHHYQRH